MRASSPLALSITWEALARMRASECWGESLTIEANLYARAMDNPDFEQGYGVLSAAAAAAAAARLMRRRRRRHLRSGRTGLLRRCPRKKSMHILSSDSRSRSKD